MTDASGVQGTSVNVSGPTESYLNSCSLGAVRGLWDDQGRRVVADLPDPGDLRSGHLHSADPCIRRRGQQPAASEDPSDATFTVTSGVGGDVDAPVVSAVTVLPGSVAAGEWVEVTWRMTDASGVQGTSVNVSGPTESYLTSCSLGAVQVSGTTKDGAWSLICQIPATSEVGTYTVRIHASDVAGNSRQLPRTRPMPRSP